MTTYGLPYIFEDRTGDLAVTEFDELYDRMFLGVSSSSHSRSSAAQPPPAPSSSSSPNSSASSSPTSSPSPARTSSSPSSSSSYPPKTLKIYELDGRSSSSPSSRGSSRSAAAAAAAASRKGKDPVVVLDFAPSGAGGGASPGGIVAGGTVLFVPQGVAMPMASWLRGSSTGSGSGKGRISRTFRCSDGEEYTWTHHANAEAEWACTTRAPAHYLAAQYNLRAPAEPRYASSSGNTLTVYEAYAPLSAELLAALVVVRCMERWGV